MHRRSLLNAIPAAALLPVAVKAAAVPVSPVTIGIMGGEIDGTFMRVATDLTSAMNNDTMRVVPIVGKGSLQNVGDLLHLPGVDLALIAADVLAYAKAANLYPGELSKIEYICKLYDNDMHVCARNDIRSLNDLKGQPVNIDVEGAGTNLTARAVFTTLGIAPDFRTDEPTTGQDKLMRGDIAANVYTGGKPIRLFATVPAGSGLHFLSVPSTEALEKTYIPGGRFTHSDYPTLIAADETIETIGVGVVLAVFGWQPNAPRYRGVVAFVDAFFSKFPDLLKPPHHPKWHDVNLRAAQPGWTRFKPAADWLARHGPVVAADPAKTGFDRFLAERGVPNLTPAQREATWQYFQERINQPR
jgi:TRAP transporter TAXI family solute receptor